MSKTTGTCIELKRKKIQKGTFEHIQRHTLDDMLIITGGGLLARSTNMTVLSAVEAADRFRGKKDTIVNTREGEVYPVRRG